MNKIPWDDIFDCSKYKKTTTKIIKKTYKVIEVIE